MTAYWILKNIYFPKVNITTSPNGDALYFAWKVDSMLYRTYFPLPKGTLRVEYPHDAKDTLILHFPLSVNIEHDRAVYMKRFESVRATLSCHANVGSRVTANMLRVGTGYRVSLAKDAISLERTKIGYQTSATSSSVKTPLAPQAAEISFTLGKSHSILVTLPLHVGVRVKTGSPAFSLVSADAEALGNAKHVVQMAKPRNPYTGAGVVEAGKVYPKLKTTKRGAKK